MQERAQKVIACDEDGPPPSTILRTVHAVLDRHGLVRRGVPLPMSPGRTSVVVAEGVGFEPTIRLPVYTLSKRAPSATRPSLRGTAGPEYSEPRCADNASRDTGPLQQKEAIAQPKRRTTQRSSSRSSTRCPGSLGF